MTCQARWNQFEEAAFKDPDVRWGRWDRQEIIVVREVIEAPYSLKRNLIAVLPAKGLAFPSRVWTYRSSPSILRQVIIINPSMHLQSDQTSPQTSIPAEFQRRCALVDLSCCKRRLFEHPDKSLLLLSTPQSFRVVDPSSLQKHSHINLQNQFLFATGWFYRHIPPVSVPNWEIHDCLLYRLVKPDRSIRKTAHFVSLSVDLLTLGPQSSPERDDLTSFLHRFSVDDFHEFKARQILNDIFTLSRGIFEIGQVAPEKEDEDDVERVFHGIAIRLRCWKVETRPPLHEQSYEITGSRSISHVVSLTTKGYLIQRMAFGEYCLNSFFASISYNAVLGSRRDATRQDVRHTLRAAQSRG
ncbi:hypothetical protein HD553DRAFT_327205 [Filobasidium floriforme]|uniref:uncharacterized protein n=1 Tax=Filobasidium floriforme TaxID=5210 RepID=UPI001E8D8C3D|nr:uncharacterized protein HD553DRAFT_327205 [Filobasidium floriforme]KAH8077697.1 hypothetical protein HD553DRAFT_327205 [Filobasidium floriforme]